MKTLSQNRESGFTLLELLLVIGVAALLLIGGIATYRLVSEGNKATEATRLLLTVRQEAGVMAQQQGGKYDGIVYTSATTTDSVLTLTGVLRIQQRNPFNGMLAIVPVAVTQAPTASTPPTAVTEAPNVWIYMDGLSRAACIKMAQAINDPNQVRAIGINAVAATLPITLAAATAATGGCNATSNSIQWIFN